MTLRYQWRQVGSTGRAHMRLADGRSSGWGGALCGTVRGPVAWMPEDGASRCGSCLRLLGQMQKRAAARRAAAAIVEWEVVP